MFFYFVGAWGLLTICGIVNRILLRKLRRVYKVSSDRMWDRMWRVWSLLAVEPILSTFVAIVWLFWITNLENWTWLIPWFIQYKPVMIQLCILLFIARIWVIGKGIRRARLAITVLSARLVILSVPLVLVLLGINSSKDHLDTTVMVSLFIAYLFRILFGIYQNYVTPNSVQFLRMHQINQDIIGMRNRARNDDLTLRSTGNTRHSSTIPAIDTGVEDGIVLTEDNDLWDEQVALIERLKGEEGAAEHQLVNQTQELL